jgi:hypothetical protein
MAAVAMLSLSFLMVLRSSQKEHQGSQENLSALYACEAGLTKAVDQLSRGETGDIGSKNYPADIGDQTFWVKATDVGNGCVALESHGRSDGSKVGVELVVKPAENGFFRWAAFGDESMHLDSNARTDSYDSGDGTYLAQQIHGSGANAYANTEGDIGSNYNVTMNSNDKVWGDATPGPTGTVSGSGVANIYGNTTPLTAPIVFPPIVVPSISPVTALTVSSTTTLASGNYNFSLLMLNASKTLNIVGPATIVCSDFKLKSGSTVSIDASNGPVKFYVVNDFVMSSNTRIASTTWTPSDVEINLLSDNILDPGIDIDFDEDLVDFSSNSKLYGTVYAPSAKIEIKSNFELFGAMIARRVDLRSYARIHYDETLATNGSADGQVYSPISWRLISQP